ncbi:MAG: hypothetical protein RL385_4118 [Pseudomonadota bacterium]
MYCSSMDERPSGALPLPSLAALRAFEAAARHGSFTRAAEELCVTQAAVSHQVKLLEEELGQPLFTRRVRQVDLTPFGRAWAEALEPAFARIYAANRALRSPALPQRPVVSVSVLPSFASRWLVPRLGRFLELAPHIDLRISPSTELVDVNASDIDVGIRYGLGRYPAVRCRKLSGDAYVCVAAPALKESLSIAHARELPAAPLLHDDSPERFLRWLAAHGVRRASALRGPVFTDSSLLIDACLRGQGVALVRLALAADELGAGRLVRLFPRMAPWADRNAYYVVTPTARAPSEAAKSFVAWLQREAEPLRRALGPGA